MCACVCACVCVCVCVRFVSCPRAGSAGVFCMITSMASVGGCTNDNRFIYLRYKKPLCLLPPCNNNDNNNNNNREVQCDPMSWLSSLAGERWSRLIDRLDGWGCCCAGFLCDGTRREQLWHGVANDGRVREVAHHTVATGVQPLVVRQVLHHVHGTCDERTNKQQQRQQGSARRFSCMRTPHMHDDVSWHR